MLVRLAGPFSITGDGTRYSRGVIGGKAQTLLKLLAAARGRLVPIDYIVDVLWEGDPPKRPADNVATLVSRLRRALGTPAITGGRAGYRLGQAPIIRVDLDEAAALIIEAEGRLAADEPTIAGAAATRALELLNGGSVLEEEPYAEWAEAARIEMAGLLRRARLTAATAALRTAEPAAARRAAEAAVMADRFDEEAHRQLMRAHAAVGEPARALMVYERLRQALAAELGTDPAPETRAIHLAILRERLPASSSDPPNAPEPTRPNCAMLAGRDAEIAHVDQAWTAAKSGQPALLVVAGEAGIGKSRLVGEAMQLATLTGGTVMQARCYETERSLFLQPFIDALTPQVTRFAGSVLREVASGGASALAALVPDVSRVLGSLPDERSPAETRRSRIYEAVTVFLRGLAAKGPVLLVLDDLHNSGPPTIELVHYLARRAAHARLLLLITTVRSEEGEEVLRALHDVATRLDLGPLASAAVVQLAAAAGQDELAESIFQQTRGHTLSVVETLRGLAAGESCVPESLRLAALGRVRRMGEQTERLLRAAAVLGSAFEPLALAEMLGLTPHEAAYHCERALAARLLVVAGQKYEFANELIRKALDATTPAPTRRIHRLRASQLRSPRTEPMSAHAPCAGLRAVTDG